MKKVFKLIAAASLALAMFVPAQAETLTIFDDVSTTADGPIYGYNYDSEGYITQTIFPEAELTAMQGSFITSMKFYIANENGNVLSGGKMAISVGTTTETAFAGWSASPITGLTHVADITMTAGETEVVVNFNTPFCYTGDNLVFEAVVTESAAWGDLYFYGASSSTSNILHQGYSTSSTGFNPKTTFEYEELQDFASLTPTEIDFGKVYIDNEATQTITLKNMGQNAFTPVFGALEAPFILETAATEVAPGESMEISVKFAPVAEGEYDATLTIDCGAAGNFMVVMKGKSTEVPNEVVVCEGDDSNPYLPVYGYYYDMSNSKGQMVYNAELLTNLNGKKITSVTFHPTAGLEFYGGKLQLSFKIIEEAGFTTYSAFTGLDVVATLVPTEGDTELTFVLDEPFEYTGGNLLIETLNIETGSYGNTRFYGTNISVSDGVHPAFYTYGYGNSDYANFLPMASFGYQKEDTHEPIMGDANGDRVVDIQDVTALIDALLDGNFSGIDMDAANCNGDNGIDVQDVTALIDFLLNGHW